MLMSVLQGLNSQAQKTLFLKKLIFVYSQKLKKITHLQTPIFSKKAIG